MGKMCNDIYKYHPTDGQHKMRGVSKMRCKCIAVIISALMILSILSLPVFAAYPRTVRGYVYVNGVVTKPDQVILHMSSQDIPAKELFDDGYYIIDFSAEDNETGTFTVVVNGNNYPVNKTFITEHNVYVYYIDLHVWTSGENHPPDKPSYPSPANGATGVDIDVTLSWQCIDPDGDNLTYDVYFGTSSNPPKVSDNQSSTSYTPSLNYGETYYWRIVAWDEHGEKSEGDVWTFTTKSKPSSGGGGTGGGTGGGSTGGTTGGGATGGTTGGGASTGGPVEETPPNNPPVADPGGPYYGIAGTVITFNASGSHDPENSTIEYRWDFDGDGTWDTEWLATPYAEYTYQVAGNYTVILEVKDDLNATSSAQTTAIIAKAYNYPPNEPSIDGPSSGYVNESYSFTIVATDNDGDAIKYFISWGDGTTTETDFLPNGTSIDLNHSWSQPGNYTISVKAYDNNTYSGEVKWNISVKSKTTTKEEDLTIYYLLIGILLILLVILILLTAARRKKKEEEKKKKAPTKSKGKKKK